VAKPMLEKDSHAKVVMRKKVRGLRDIEKQVIADRAEAKANSGSDDAANRSETAIGAPVTAVVPSSETVCSEPGANEPAVSTANTSETASSEPVSAVVLASETPSSETVLDTAMASTPTSDTLPGSQPPAAAALSGNEHGTAAAATASKPTKDEAGDVVLDYCAAVRGILNDDQGGPLHPTGLRMAEALKDVRESIGRNLDEKKGGRAEAQLNRLAKCIDRGLQEVAQEQEEVKEYVKEVKRVEATLDPSKGNRKQRKRRFARLRRRLARSGDPVRMQMAAVMVAFAVGLFAGPEAAQQIKDNLELERWFRLPKGHERRIHGRRHAGVRLVQEGATLMPTLDAHKDRDKPFTAEELLGHKDAKAPREELEAIHRRKVMRRARSKKRRPALLAELERRYKAAP